MGIRIICDGAEIAVETLQAAEAIGLDAAPEVAEAWLATASEALQPGGLVGLAVTALPALDDLVELAELARTRGAHAAMTIVAEGPPGQRTVDVARDLGIAAVGEVEPLVAALQLLRTRAQSPWDAALRALPAVDRVRLRAVMGSGARTGGHLRRAEAGHVLWSDSADGPGVDLGRARDVAAALCALRATDPGTPRLSPSVEGVDEREVTDVLFGPRRALSDPASKAALTPYGIPVPLEELCGSASRAASEASRIGYPVRISLASPDLRIWDHPDLTVDMVDNAARVRDTFHQLMGVAKARLDGGSDTSERILGAMVTATSDAVARLGVVAWPLSGGRVAMDIGFADPHGRAADDRTLAVLPAPLGAIERALRRLRGHSLVLGGSAAQRRTHLEAIGDVLLRLAAFVHDRRDDVESVELRPVALLLDGTVEVREACVRVSDAFERSLRGAAAR
ncbi:MAG: acetate--CoA ligase family protein [Myxococcales bacterium]